MEAYDNPEQSRRRTRSFKADRRWRPLASNELQVCVDVGIGGGGGGGGESRSALPILSTAKNKQTTAAKLLQNRQKRNLLQCSTETALY